MTRDPAVILQEGWSILIYSQESLGILAYYIKGLLLDSSPCNSGIEFWAPSSQRAIEPKVPFSGTGKHPGAMQFLWFWPVQYHLVDVLIVLGLFVFIFPLIF